MGDVINLADRRPGEFVGGPMLCTACKYEWHGSVPAGLVSGFECPNCGSGRGLLKFPVVPKEIWTCACGGDLFHLTPIGAPTCRECGGRANGWVSEG